MNFTNPILFFIVTFQVSISINFQPAIHAPDLVGFVKLTMSTKRCVDPFPNISIDNFRYQLILIWMLKFWKLWTVLMNSRTHWLQKSGYWNMLTSESCQMFYLRWGFKKRHARGRSRGPLSEPISVCAQMLKLKIHLSIMKIGSENY